MTLKSLSHGILLVQEKFVLDISRCDVANHVSAGSSRNQDCRGLRCTVLQIPPNFTARVQAGLISSTFLSHHYFFSFQSLNEKKSLDPRIFPCIILQLNEKFHKLERG